MPRYNPDSIVTDAVCDYGCGLIARFRFKSGKLCCNDAVQKCDGHIKRGIATKRNDIDENGLNPMQRGQLAAHESKKRNGGYEKAGKSISKTKNEITDSGLRRCDISNQRMRQTKLVIGEDGLSNAQRSARKAADSRLADIDHTGLNQYERWTLKRINEGTFDEGFRKSGLIKKDVDTGIRYQGSYELKFINDLKSRHGVRWVKENLRRGPSIKYVDCHGKSRWYMSDFIIEDTVYEIKSEWTWNRRGRDLMLEQNNMNKLTATVESGYRVKLILEEKEIDYASIAK